MGTTWASEDFKFKTFIYIRQTEHVQLIQLGLLLIHKIHKDNFNLPSSRYTYRLYCKSGNQIYKLTN